MTGLEGLAALGLACNIFQVISFGHETIHILKSIYQHDSFDDSLAEYSVTLRTISSDIEAIGAPGRHPKKYEEELVKAATKCQIISRGIQDEINFILGQPAKGSLVKTFKVAWRATWRKKRLERMEKDLSRVEDLMTTSLLARCWQVLLDNVNTLDLEAKEINQNLKDFLDKYRAGHQDLRDLIQQQVQAIKDHTSIEAEKLKQSVVQESKQSEQELKQHFNVTSETSTDLLRNHMLSLELERRQEEKREKLLNSFKYAGMNERRNRVNDPHPNTFHWILSDEAEIKDKDPLYPCWDMFPDWLRSNQKIYWICGKPGSGKTTLVRFIVSNPQTTKLLEVWQRNPVLISHFLWRAGSDMQQSISGVLCSFLYQLLSQSAASCELVYNKIPESKTKDSHRDWSTTDLQLALDLVIRNYESPICMFLDGVDEVSPNDGVVQLLAVIHQFSQHHNIKICLSSRPEPMILKRMNSYPQLRIQDLTEPDLESFAHDSLEQLKSQGILEEHMNIHKLQSLLVSLSEGVFLWLSLAIKSVIRGIEYGDSMTEIMERIENMRGDLYALYDDMWKRLDEDTDVYQRSAATFFRFILEKRDFRSVYQGSSGQGMSLLELLMATTALPEKLLRHERPLVSVDDILGECKLLEQHVRVRCAGLLDIGPERREWPYRDKPFPQEYQSIVPYVKSSVQFVHRTAYDFLRDTDKGKEILKHDDSSVSEIQARLYMAQVSLHHIRMWPFGFNVRVRLETQLYPIARLSQFLEIVSIDAHNNNGSVIPTMEKVLYLAIDRYRMMNQQRWLIDDFSERLSGQCSDTEFNQLCVGYGLYGYVKDSVSRLCLEKSDLNLLLCHAVLRPAASLPTYSDGSLCNEFCRVLLEKGADPNSKYPLSVYVYPEHCFDNSPLSLTALKMMSIPGLAMQASAKYDGTVPYIAEWLERLALFADHGADFEMPSCCVIQTIYKTKIRQPGTNEITEAYTLHARPFIDIFSPVMYYPDTDATEGYACVIMLPASVLVDSCLMAIQHRPEYRKNLHAWMLSEKLSGISQVLENGHGGHGGQLVAIFNIQHLWQQMKHSSRGINLDAIPYQQVPSDIETSGLRILEETPWYRHLNGEKEMWLDYIKQAQVGHGSLLKRLCDVGIMSRRIYRDEKGAQFSWEEARDIPGKLPPWRLSLEPKAPPKPKLDASEVAGLLEHRECCKDWVDGILDQT